MLCRIFLRIFRAESGKPDKASYDDTVKKMDYEIIRSNRRTLCLEITRDGRVLVRAPHRLPLREIERFAAAKADWIRTHMEKRLRYNEAHPQPTAEQEVLWRKRAETVLPPLVRSMADEMGVVVTSVQINGAKTRFGSCSTGGRIHFSYRLMAYPPEVIRYVVIHELAHIRHPNHGRAFWQEVEKYCPDYRVCRARLKE